MDERSAPCKALVLAGGGARGSYQVGVWLSLIHISEPQTVLAECSTVNYAVYQVLEQNPALTVKDGTDPLPVSYTHLDVYKRQVKNCIKFKEKICRSARSSGDTPLQKP